MLDSLEFNRINIINISTQNNFCGYYALARRIINDKNFTVILDKFNQFYQTNWYYDQLVEVVDKMHPEQADIMLGLAIQHHYPLSSLEGTGLSNNELKLICQAFGYEPVIFLADNKDYASSVKKTLQEPLTNKILIFDEPSGQADIGHYNLIEPDDEIFAMDLSRRDPSYDESTYSINNQGGDQFIKNIKASVAEIKPNWTNQLKNQQIQDDKNLAWELAIADVRAKNLLFFKDQPTETDIEKTIIDLQRKEIEYYNNLLSR